MNALVAVAVIPLLVSFMGSGPSVHGSQPFQGQVSASLSAIAQRPQLHHWLDTVREYKVQFHPAPGCTGAMCSAYHTIGGRVFVIIGIKPGSLNTPGDGAAKIIHELQHARDRARGCSADHYRAWRSMQQASSYLDVTADLERYVGQAVEAYSGREETCEGEI